MLKKRRSSLFKAQAILDVLFFVVILTVILAGLQNYSSVIFDRKSASGPVNGGWSSWSPCSPCGFGNYQVRICSEPYPANGGLSCVGAKSQICPDMPCAPVDCTWSAWSGCPACAPAGMAAEETRTCTCPSPPTPVGQSCVGPHSRSCPSVACLGDVCAWGAWGPCLDSKGNIMACGVGGKQLRTCFCTDQQATKVFCTPDEKGVTDTRNCPDPALGCDCLTASFPTADPRCTDITVPNTSNGSILAPLCPPGCTGSVTLACHEGSWTFFTEKCVTLCGNGICDPGETDVSCAQDCCGANTPCQSVTRALSNPPEYCRSMNGGAYAWITVAQANTYCDDPSESCVSTAACEGGRYFECGVSMATATTNSEWVEGGCICLPDPTITSNKTYCSNDKEVTATYYACKGTCKTPTQCCPYNGVRGCGYEGPNKDKTGCQRNSCADNPQCISCTAGPSTPGKPYCLGTTLVTPYLYKCTGPSCKSTVSCCSSNGLKGCEYEGPDGRGWCQRSTCIENSPDCSGKGKSSTILQQKIP